MTHTRSPDYVNDLFLPTLLFAALGGMTWAVRGSSGYGAVAGCIFAGVGWGAAWWYLARDDGSEPRRRYSSSWIILALTLGIGFSGARGWMQWPSFFEGKILTNYGAGESLPISRIYGFAWLFIAGVPWAGLGACLMAWCGSLRETRAGHWFARLACGLGAAFLAWYWFENYPQFFLPMYESLSERYHDFEQNPNLRRLINDSRLAIIHLGLYLGFLGFELARREWKNVTLITTVGLLNGAGWALLQNWKWAHNLWPDANFNWWRCWESSGGISIGIAYGVAWFLVNRPMSTSERTELAERPSIWGPTLDWLFVVLALGGFIAFMLVDEDAGPEHYWPLSYPVVCMLFAVAYYYTGRARFATQPASSPWRDPNLERLGLYLGLLFGLGFSIRSGLKGWFNIYRGDEEYWSRVLWHILGPSMLVLLVALWIWTLLRPLPRDFRGQIFPRAAVWIWLVLIVLNVLAQLVTGPWSQWNEVAFSIYYILLFFITAVIVIYYTRMSPATA